MEEWEVLFINEGSDGAGEPDDRGCEFQSSERESSHACSIVLRWLDLRKFLRCSCVRRHVADVVVDSSRVWFRLLSDGDYILRWMGGKGVPNNRC